MPGQREGGGEASIRPALFRRPPFPGSERERHLNKAAYQSPSAKGVAKLHNTHHLPPAAPVTKEREKKEGRDAGEEKLLRSTQISQNPNSSLLGCLDNQLRHSRHNSVVASSTAIYPKTNKVLCLNSTGACMWAPAGAPCY